MTLDEAIRIAEEDGGSLAPDYDTWQESENAFIFSSSKHSGFGGFGSPFVVYKDTKEVSCDYAGYCFSKSYKEPFARGKLI